MFGDTTMMKLMRLKRFLSTLSPCFVLFLCCFPLLSFPRWRRRTSVRSARLTKLSETLEERRKPSCEWDEKKNKKLTQWMVVINKSNSKLPPKTTNATRERVGVSYGVVESRVSTHSVHGEDASMKIWRMKIYRDANLEPGNASDSWIENFSRRTETKRFWNQSVILLQQPQEEDNKTKNQTILYFVSFCVFID